MYRVDIWNRIFMQPYVTRLEYAIFPHERAPASVQSFVHTSILISNTHKMCAEKPLAGIIRWLLCCVAVTEPNYGETQRVKERATDSDAIPHFPITSILVISSFRSSSVTDMYEVHELECVSSIYSLSTWTLKRMAM